MNERQLADFAQAFVTSLKAVSGTPTAIYAHGPGGLFSTPTAPDVINALVSPLSGLNAVLPYRRSMYDKETFDILTGISANTGSQNTTACADAKQVGNLMTCRQVIPFGRMSLESQVVQIDRVGRLLNRGDMLDYRVVGNPFATVDAPGPLDIDAALRDEGQKKLIELYNGWNIEYAHLTFDGNPSNTTGNTGYQEYPGLDIQINTGKVDAVTSTACAGADSVIYSAGNAEIGSSAALYLRLLTEAYNQQRYRAKQAGLGDVEFAFVMRYGAFRELSAIWPCAYATAQCGANVQASGMEYTRMRDEMRNQSYLLIDGTPVRVIIDDTIAETSGGTGIYRSTIYLLPLRSALFTSTGGWITYKEFLDVNTPMGPMDVARRMAPADSFQSFGGGRFLLHKKPPTNECVQIRITANERLIVRAPFLAARITGVQYTPFVHELSGYPGNPNFVGGGVTGRT